MLTNLKALVVILALSLVIFAVAKPFFLRYMEAAVFERRRNIWLSLTVLGFASPSIWIYALVAMPIMYLGAKKDPNPLALYVLIYFVIPNVSIQVPTIGIGQLLELNQRRMLSLAILAPLAFRTRAIPGMATRRRLTAMDWSLIGLGLLQIALAVPYDTATTTARRASIFFLDTFLMFYVFAQLAAVPKILKEVLLSFLLAIVIMSAVGAFESTRGWLLYAGIGPVWGAIEPFTNYITRGSMVRASASSGHALALGYMTAMGLGFWFYFSTQEAAKGWRKWMIYAVLLAGCFSSGSRGGWVTAVVLFSCFALLRPHAARFLAKAIPVVMVAIFAAYLSPLKESVIDKLPIIGHSDQDTVEYREQIAEVSWRLIKQHPVLGDPFALRNMEELRQGQGIIDIMNGYANVALFQGGVGLALFVSLFVMVIWQCLVTMGKFRKTDPDLALMGADLIACLLATLFFIGTAAVEPAAYWLSGIMVSYCSVALSRRSTSTVISTNTNPRKMEEHPLARRP